MDDFEGAWVTRDGVTCIQGAWMIIHYGWEGYRLFVEYAPNHVLAPLWYGQGYTIGATGSRTYYDFCCREPEMYKGFGGGPGAHLVAQFDLCDPRTGRSILPPDRSE